MSSMNGMCGILQRQSCKLNVSVHRHDRSHRKETVSDMRPLFALKSHNRMEEKGIKARQVPSFYSSSVGWSRSRIPQILGCCQSRRPSEVQSILSRLNTRTMTYQEHYERARTAQGTQWSYFYYCYYNCYCYYCFFYYYNSRQF